MWKVIGALALALFIDAAFLASIAGPGPAAPSRVVVGELAFAPRPAGWEEPPVVVAEANVQGRRAVR